MLSVLIPAFNFSCYRLVKDLQLQLEECGHDYEIIVSEDGSTDQAALVANLKINELPNCRYIRHNVNVGKAANLNCLIKESAGDWVLLLDCDAEIEDDHYIRRYQVLIKDNPEVDILAGGIRHPEHCPNPYCTLRYQYEKAADRHRTAIERNKHPFFKFSSFNVLFRRCVFDKCRFNEAPEYTGYEDIFLGFALREAGFKISHIDNPVLHIRLESNEQFLNKVRSLVNGLKDIGPKMKATTRLQKTSAYLQRCHVSWLIRIAFVLSQSFIRRNLLSQKPNLKLFAFYRLGLYLQA